ncbi:NAD(FAD)-utilizing dehydrogenase [Streptomyces laurentii]|uniref:NAD(FAD)-utilizing dehydrogenase n=1 Tax=Streptomyces laurentii TaxID=39478 RepID=A0A160NWW2_STRLU|nr:NAD(FAD)-utilizing dehydrogenase [Streptomyces laurentii]
MVGERGPGLLAVHDPVAAVAVADGAGADGGEVGAGAGFAVALAPQFFDCSDPWEEPGLLFLGAVVDQGGAEELLADVVDAGGGVGEGVLLVEGELLREARAASAVLLGPADAGPAVVGHVPFPGEAFGERLVFPAGAAESLQSGELAAEPGLQPVAYRGAELLDAAHGHTLTYQTLVREGCAAAMPDVPGSSRLPRSSGVLVR